MSEKGRKFEEARKRFRENWERENQKRRRTIFLEEDDLPSSSRRKAEGPNQDKRKTPVQPKRETGSCYRMSTNERATSPTRQQQQSAQTRTNTAEERSPTLNEDDRPTPPRPKGTRNQAQVMHLGYTETRLTAEEEAVVEEIRRTFFGREDRTVSIRPMTPPSPLPPRSPPSLDSENEAYDPPPPPRRQGYGTVEVKDQEYQHLGFQCYERTMTIKLLVPATRQQPMLKGSGDHHSGSAQNTRPEMVARHTESPPPRAEQGKLPITPGRGWLRAIDNMSPNPTTNTGQPYVDENNYPRVTTPTTPGVDTISSTSSSPTAASTGSSNLLSTASPSKDTSTPRSSSSSVGLATCTPESSPHPQMGVDISTTPPRPTGSQQLQLSQLPAVLRQGLADIIQSRTTYQRVRLRREYRGQQFKIQLERNGQIHIDWLAPPSKSNP